jgi:hypothetical protein
VLNLLTLALQAALVLVILFVLWELLRLWRAVRFAQASLPDLDTIRQVEKSLRAATSQAQSETATLSRKIEALRSEAERLTPVADKPEATSVDTPVEPEAKPEPEPPSSSSRPGPRILSEAGRAKYDRVLHLAARGLDADSIAREVDLTRAEVELMLGPTR